MTCRGDPLIAAIERRMALEVEEEQRAFLCPPPSSATASAAAKHVPPPWEGCGGLGYWVLGGQRWASVDYCGRGLAVYRV